MLVGSSPVRTAQNGPVPSVDDIRRRAERLELARASLPTRSPVLVNEFKAALDAMHPPEWRDLVRRVQLGDAGGCRMAHPLR